jgi:hypothetical protein
VERRRDRRFLKTGGKPEEVSVPASIVGLPENESGYSLHDLWTGKTKTGETKKTSRTINAVVPSHGVVRYFSGMLAAIRI